MQEVVHIHFNTSIYMLVGDEERGERGGDIKGKKWLSNLLYEARWAKLALHRLM